MIPWDAGQLTLKEAGCERVEPFLAGSVPNLHFDSLATNGNHLHFEVDGNGWDVVHGEILRLKSLEKTGFADSGFPDDDNFD